MSEYQYYEFQAIDRRLDIAPGPAGILALAVASLADIPAAERELLTRKLEERER